MIPGHLVAIQLDAEAWPFRHRERTADVREWLGHDIVGLMVIVRVDSIRQIGGRGREVDGGRRQIPSSRSLCMPRPIWNVSHTPASFLLLDRPPQ